MSTPSIGFVGGGRVATILLGGWARAHALPPNLVVSDPDAGVRDRLRGRHPTITCVPTGDPAAARQEVVFLALHPPAFGDALPAVQAALRRDAIVVSLAPRITIARISEMLGGFAGIARLIPNAPSIVNMGYNPIAFGAGLMPNDRERVRALLKPLGDCPVVDESRLEAYAILSGMGPTYFWPQLVELDALGRRFGLSEQESREALRAMAIGTVETLNQSGMSVEAVQDLIPVKPLADAMPALLEAYRTQLTELMDKIRPQSPERR
ncbi:MAG: NAD(P)-binding domain-containing protein [Planctomycetes bacterium]|nr:NAD(P)-binding domain-containing protein [Planctomycetota bacterium]